MELDHIKRCEVAIPKGGAKLLMIEGRIIFTRPLKGLVYFYDTNTKLQLCAVQAERFDYAVELIKRRIKEIVDERDCTSLFG